MASSKLAIRLEEIEPERLGRRYGATEELFIVGAKDGSEWRVHESVLAQSPVLARECETLLSKGSARVFGLSEAEPAVLGLVIEYLYSGDYAPVLKHTYITNNHCTVALAFQEGGSPDRQALLFTKVYVVADRLGLGGLMNLTVQKIKLVGELSDERFYDMADMVYSCCATRGSAFREYFLEHAPPRLRKLQGPALTTLLKRIGTGGPLASDFFLAQHRAIIELKENAAKKAAVSKSVAQLTDPTKESKTKKRKAQAPGQANRIVKRPC